EEITVFDTYNVLAACLGFTQVPPAFQLLDKFNPTSKPSFPASCMANAMSASDESLINAGPAGTIPYGRKPISKISTPPRPAFLITWSSSLIRSRSTKPLSHHQYTFGRALPSGFLNAFSKLVTSDVPDFLPPNPPNKNGSNRAI